MVGVNVNFTQGFAPGAVAATGAKWVRQVLYQGYDHGPDIYNAHALGLKMLGVIARESIGSWSPATAATFYADNYGDTIDAIQVGNEPDILSDSSWTMEPAEASALITTFRLAFGESTTIIGPALANGRGSLWWLEQLPLELLDAVAINLYGVRVRNYPTSSWGFDDLSTVVEAYTSALVSCPLWITEYGVRLDDVDGDVYKQGALIGELTAALLTDSRVQVATLFAYDDIMAPGFGLLDHGAIKPAYTAFARAISQHGERMPATKNAEFRLGFATFAAAHPEVGEPLETEMYFTADDGRVIAIQPTTQGELHYYRDANEIHFFVAGE